MKTTYYSIIVSVLLFFGAGCQRRGDAGDASTAGKSPTLFFVTAPEEPLNTERIFSEVSIMSAHKAVLRLNKLTPGKPYVARWTLLDSKGVAVVTNDHPFVSQQSEYNVWYNYRPDHQKQKAGTWKWSVEIKGLGKFSTKLTVLPPTPADLQLLARHQQAREEVFKAFSHAWLGYRDSYFTTVVIDETRNWNGWAKAMKPGDPKESVLILQVNGLSYNFENEFVTDADRQNGVSYRSVAGFRFTTFRYFSQNGWGDWIDTERYENQFHQTAARLYESSVPRGFQENHCLSFKVQCKDGHWHVTADNGDAFINGQLNYHPTNNTGLRQVFQPNRTIVASIATQEGKRRVEDRLLGQQIKASPQEIGRNSIETMTMLRGRTL